MTRYDIYNDFHESTYVAYCYQGQYVGSLAFFNGESVMILLPQGYLMEQAEIMESHNLSKGQFHNFELWAFVHEIEDENLQQQAINRLYDVNGSFYSTVEFIRNTQFTGFNDGAL